MTHDEYYFSSLSKKLVSNKISKMKANLKQYEFQILFISKSMARRLIYFVFKTFWKLVI